MTLHPPKVFVSYSHDNEPHGNWVLTLATRLVANGVDVMLDQWDLNLGSDLPRFMESGLTGADRVLAICTHQYVLKANEGVGGVGYEKMILTARLMQDIKTDKIIPVIRDNYLAQPVPTFLSSRVYIDFRDDAAYEERYAELIREIHGQKIKPKPPLGRNPFLVVSALACVDAGRYGNAINAILDLTKAGKHQAAVEAATYLCTNRGTATDWGLLFQACRRSDHDLRSRIYPSVIQSAESWFIGPKYEYRAQTLASLLTLLRLMDDKARFWQIYHARLHDADKRGNEFLLAEYAQMLRQDNKDKYVAEWIPTYEALPESLRRNDLLKKLYIQALLDQGTVPLDQIKATLQHTNNEKFKTDLFKRIDALSQERGSQPRSTPPHHYHHPAPEAPP
jgi:hypothetical protein